MLGGLLIIYSIKNSEFKKASGRDDFWAESLCKSLNIQEEQAEVPGGAKQTLMASTATSGNLLEI